MNTQSPPSWLYDICLSLTSVTWYRSHSVHPGCWQRPYSAPLCGWAVFLHREICLHFPVKGPFGEFGVLANVCRAALRTGRCVLFWNMTFFSGSEPRGGITGLYGFWMLKFCKEPPCRFPRLLHQFSFPPRVQEVSAFRLPFAALNLCRSYQTCPFWPVRRDTSLYFWFASL